MLIPVKGLAMVEVVSTGVSHLCDNSTVSVKECLSPPTSSSCRCKAWVHRGGTHMGSQVHI